MPGMALDGDSQVWTRCLKGPKLLRGRKPHGFNFLPLSLG
jgi:hypothetical protein